MRDDQGEHQCSKITETPQAYNLVPLRRFTAHVASIRVDAQTCLCTCNLPGTRRLLYSSIGARESRPLCFCDVDAGGMVLS